MRNLLILLFLSVGHLYAQSGSEMLFHQIINHHHSDDEDGILKDLGTVPEGHVWKITGASFVETHHSLQDSHFNLMLKTETDTTYRVVEISRTLYYGNGGDGPGLQQVYAVFPLFISENTTVTTELIGDNGYLSIVEYLVE